MSEPGPSVAWVDYQAVMKANDRANEALRETIRTLTAENEARFQLLCAADARASQLYETLTPALRALAQAVQAFNDAEETGDVYHGHRDAIIEAARQVVAAIPKE